jgi:hypothetical protein
MSVEAQKSIDVVEEFLKSLIYRFRQFQKNQGQKNKASTQDKAPSLDNTGLSRDTCKNLSHRLEKLICRGLQGLQLSFLIENSLHVSQAKGL